jgi:energy-coupling factor transporter ATP-binding protein EcfA2
MKLNRMRVSHFKCVLDSEWFGLGDLTCLVGKNESGKTALMEALEKLNSVQPARANFDVTEHYPRLQLSEYEESGKIATPIETEWELSDEELAHINALVGIDFLGKRTVGLTKNYANQREWTADIDYGKATTYFLDNSGLGDVERQALGDPKTITKLAEALSAIAEKTPKQEALSQTLQQRFGTGHLRGAIDTYLDGRLPRFLYYSNYDRLPGQVSLNQLATDQANNNLDRDPGNKVFIALLSMVGTTPEAIGGIAQFEPLIAKLEGVQNRLTGRIFKYWTQNKHLEVNFRFDEGAAGDPPPFNTGKVFRTRIKNNRHGVTIRLDERSAGFIWFFSFLVWFSEVTREYGDNLVVLLDEPGLSLHARAQADLLRFIKEELLSKYQVIYTTHSPFMIDSGDLLSCRTVEDASGKNDEVLGTKVGDDVLSTDVDTLFPLQAALGYDITQTLFVGENCLLVEGPSDLLYLQWFSSELQRRKRVFLDKRWTITPCGGITKVSGFMSLFGGSRLHVAVLTDYAQGDKKKVKDLRESKLLRDGYVLTADMFVGGATEADVEDIIGREMYVALVNATYDLKGKKALSAIRPDVAPERVVAEVGTSFKTLGATDPEYNHFEPARYLVESGAAGLPGLDAALDRFEALFQAANELMS